MSDIKKRYEESFHDEPNPCLMEDMMLEIERLESELEKHQWRTDIENAPRGGTRFLVCLGSLGPMTAHYDQMSHNDEYLAIHSLHPLPFEPTHWKPLDKPEE